MLSAQHIFPNQKVQRVNLYNQILQVIKSACNQLWKYFLTSEKSWFFFRVDYEIQWLKPDQKSSTLTHRIITSPEKMLTLFQSPLGFRIIEVLPYE